MADYREYAYDSGTGYQIDADIQKAREIEERADKWREKRGEEVAQKELIRETESNLEDLAIEKQMSPEILAREKEIAQDSLSAKELSTEERRDILNHYADNEKEYLAHGAVLTCDKAMLGAVMIEIDGKPIEFPGSTKESTQYTILHVEENKKSSTNGLYMATAKDTIKNKNIFPFQCNCSLLPDRQWEIDKIKENLESCKKHGTCSQLMKLSEEWDNMPSETEYFHFTDWTGNEGDGERGEKQAGINMMSMLFCKHGGLITPVTSGQTVEMPTSRYRYLIYTAEQGAVVSGLSGENEEGAIAGKPVLFDFSTNLDRGSVRYEDSPDYYIVNHEEAYPDENGLIRFRKVPGEKNEDDYYCVAMAPGFTTEAEKYCFPADGADINFGYILQVEFEDCTGKTYSMDVVVAEHKKSSDIHDFYPHNNIVEFFVDGKPKKTVTDGGNVSFDKLFGGDKVEVKRVYAYEDEALVTGNDEDGWSLRGYNDEE